VSGGGSGPTWAEAARGPAADLLAHLRADASDDPLPPARRPTRPAWQRYTGVVHQHADPGALSGADRDRFRRHVAYVSALAGLVRATDPLPAYRLEMAHVDAELGGLGPWWRPHVTAALEEALAPNAVLWLLTGGEYARAVGEPEHVRVVEPRFLRADGERSLPSATVKQCRGQFARALCEHPRLARRPGDDGWSQVELVAAGSPVRFVGEDDGVPLWREAG